MNSMIETVLQNLGQNKVSIPIHHCQFTQGMEDQSKQPSIGYEDIMKNIPDPLKEYERVRKTKHTPKSTLISHQLQPLTPVSVPTPEPVHDTDFVQQRQFYKLILHHIDPTTKVFKPDMLEAHIIKFQCDLAKNLDNEKQLFKVFGFSRKKSISLETMQTNLQGTDAQLTEDIFTYISKLLKKNLVIFNHVANERTDIITCGETPLLILQTPKYVLTHEFETIKEANDFFVDHVKAKQSTLTPAVIKDMKITELRALAKLVGIKASQKKDIQDALIALF